MLLLQKYDMTFEPHIINDSPNLNSPNDEWKKYWDSCNIGEIISTLERLIQTDRKKNL